MPKAMRKARHLAFLRQLFARSAAIQSARVISLAFHVCSDSVKANARMSLRAIKQAGG